MTEEDKRLIQQTFLSLDSNNDGFINDWELVNAFINQGMSKEEALKKCDKILQSVLPANSRRRLSLEIYTQGTLHGKLQNDEILEAQFESMDTDRDGFITQQDLKRFISAGMCIFSFFFFLLFFLCFCTCVCLHVFECTCVTERV